MTLSARSNRADPLFGGHGVYTYVYAPVCFCARVGVLTLGISLGIVRLAGLRRINPYLAGEGRAPDAFVPIKKEMETSGSGFCPFISLQRGDIIRDYFITLYI